LTKRLPSCTNLPTWLEKKNQKASTNQKAIEHLTVRPARNFADGVTKTLSAGFISGIGVYDIAD